jgi:polyisoprenoid-binding protein YceI
LHFAVACADHGPTQTPNPEGSTLRKTLKILLLAAVVVVLGAGVGVWYFFLRSTAAPEARLGAISCPTSGSAAARATPEGTWSVERCSDVFVGYRIEELLVGQTVKRTATGRTPEVEGSMTVRDNAIQAVEIKADVTKLKSDQDRRDASLRQRGLETDKFPLATFTLTKPIAFPAVPRQDEELSVTARGNLMLHGVTRQVEVPLQAKWSGGMISVSATGFPITLADYNIEVIDLAGFLKIDDHGTLEFQLVFTPA